MPPEQVKAKTYLLEKGTRAPVAQIRERVAEAFATMDTLLEGITEDQARRAPGGGGVERARDPGPPGGERIPAPSRRCARCSRTGIRR